MRYLCERHVRGNSCSLFRQKPLLLLSEHNLFELELEGEKTKIFKSPVTFAGRSVKNKTVPQLRHVTCK